MREDGVEYTFQEVIESSLSPIKDGISKIDLSITKMTEELQQVKLDTGLQQKDIDLLKEQIKSQEMSVNALKDRLSSTEVTLTNRLNELEQKDTKNKADRFDQVKESVIKKIGNVLLLAAVIGLCILLGIDYHNIISK